jgi:hypothetical protein
MLGGWSRPKYSNSRAVLIHMIQKVGAGVHTSVAAFWEPATDGELADQLIKGTALALIGCGHTQARCASSGRVQRCRFSRRYVTLLCNMAARLEAVMHTHGSAKALL